MYSYNKSRVLYPDSSFIKVSFTLCFVDFYPLGKGIIGGKNEPPLCSARLLGKQIDHKPKHNVAVAMKTCRIE